MAMSTYRIRTKVKIVRLCGSNSPLLQAILFELLMRSVTLGSNVPTIFDQEKSCFSSKLPRHACCMFHTSCLVAYFSNSLPAPTLGGGSSFDSFTLKYEIKAHIYVSNTKG